MLQQSLCTLNTAALVLKTKEVCNRKPHLQNVGEDYITAFVNVLTILALAGLHVRNKCSALEQPCVSAHRKPGETLSSGTRRSCL